VFHAFERLELRRLFAAGDVDTTFGAGGSVPVSEPFAGEGPGLLAAAGGKVVAVEAGWLERYNADGSLDATFGQNGQVALPGSVTRDAEVVAGGKILVAGTFVPAAGQNPSRAFLARYNADGSPDTAFGEEGVAWLDDIVHPMAGVLEFAVQSDGGIIVRGSDGGDVTSVDVFRLTSSGALDATFATFRYGAVTHTPGEHVLKVLAGDQILVGGTRGAGVDLNAVDHDNRQFTLARLDADGALDTSFGDDGFFAEIGMNDLAVLPDGSLLTVASDVSGVVTIARLTSGGDLFPGFGTSPGGGVAPRVLLPLGAAAGDARVQLDAGGRALIVTSGAITRIDPDDGSLDETFGRVIAERPEQDAVFSGALVRADGNILVASVGVPFTVGTSRMYLLEGDGTDPGPISFDNGTLTVAGTADDDFIFIDGADHFTAASSDLLRVKHSAGFGRVFDKADVDLLAIDALAGDDVVLMHLIDAPATISGGLGNDRLGGGNGDDSISGNAGNDRIDGGAGGDRLAGNGGRDRLAGGSGSGLVSGNDDNDRLFGGNGGDWLAGGAGRDRLFGEAGDDILNGGADPDRVMGGDGNDTFLSADEAIDDLYGGGGTDTLTAGDEDDVLTDIEVQA